MRDANNGCVVRQGELNTFWRMYARTHRQMEARAAAAVVVATGPLPVALAILVHMIHAFVCAIACFCLRVGSDYNFDHKHALQRRLS